jgi:thiosulfate dehydrogenase
MRCDALLLGDHMTSQPSRTPIVITTVVVTCVVFALGALLFVVGGFMPANADAKPGKLEHWAANRSLHATLARETKDLHGPPTSTDSVMTLGVKLYKANCAVCHGASDGKRSSIADGLYQEPPQFAKDDVTDDPIEVTYWKITHGIRFTGMPSFKKTLTDDQRWAIAAFLRHQDSLPSTALAAWKALPSMADSASH